MNTNLPFAPLTNPRASAEAKAVMDYLMQVSGKGILTGQHTQTIPQEELNHIQAVTGKLPAVCGFELLGYSPNINYADAGEACLKEVKENQGTLETAMEWAEKKGLLTFTFHWFSPLGGRDKSFYAENTDFDASRALIKGTPEHQAMLSDMDVIAELLKKFRDRHIPILWRPFHEADGTWFWWGAKGYETAKGLWRTMYQRYTQVHDLNNLIWVWNSPVPEEYPGDDCVDIISRDIYAPAHSHTDLKKEFDELSRITDAHKLAALGENGPLPGIDQIAQSHVPWCWYMTWSKDFVLEESCTTKEELVAAYTHPYAITLDRLPALY
ncbi:MAG TPA: glycoside hydrolase family 26 protein [Firmicutes bacterium]|nr:glycoside hydrolase family 26 protein [Bacillota bacterium]